MKPTLRFVSEMIQMSGRGEEASVPDFMPTLNVQNKSVFDLEEDDEIYEGYGKLETMYPYRSYTCYDRRTEERSLQTAVLENEFLQAVFLPELGGRLWRLTDKKTDHNLLYTNDVIRPSNLATRNAWFSGGVEWNVGMIGHTPFTMDAMFTACLEDEKGNPVLRMYEYERIRKVVYQMDFWLEENSRFLNARMRIVNDSSEVIPMYWWSNMAVPEYQDGRIICPAQEAYTSDSTRVYKVKLPFVDGVDVTKYRQIPDQVDYFFHIPASRRKYIVNINRHGYGLLHISTNRLQGRKLFVWGHNDASARWQEFLTEQAGDYIEIQAGLGKTQYGCIPMAPHTAWEWVEEYGPVQTDASLAVKPFRQAEEEMEQYIEKIFKQELPEKKLYERKALARTKGKLVQSGSGYGALENACRLKGGENLLSEHLDFTSTDERQQEWYAFLENGFLATPEPSGRPSAFMKDEIWFGLLKKSIAGRDRDNWYAHYQLGLQYLYRADVEHAVRRFESSLALQDNPWAWHGMAVCLVRTGRRGEGVRAIWNGLLMRLEDLPYVKEGMSLLLQMQAHDKMLEVYDLLAEKLKEESRVRFLYIQALAGVGEYRKAMDLLMEKGGLEIADIRDI